MSKQLVIAIAVVVPAVFGGFLLIKQNNLNTNANELRDKAGANISAMSPDDTKYVQDHIQKFHSRAFKEAVKDNGLIAAAEIDEGIYERALFTLIMEAAKADKRDAVARQIENDLKLMGGPHTIGN